MGKNEVLMMQEAKSSCAGQWYLPAGRMEAGEDVAEAARREVMEETGLEFELSTLFLVETAQGSWYRFVVTGSVTARSTQCAQSTRPSRNISRKYLELKSRPTSCT